MVNKQLLGKQTVLIGFGLIRFLLLIPAFAQTPVSILTGRVLDARTSQPLPFATVYLNNSSRGTVADSNGVYRLTNVPVGNTDLVGSVLGYQTLRQTLRLTDTRPRTIDIKLEPADQALATVTVTARRSPAYARQLRIFIRELFGNRPQARQCQLMNPEVLAFEEEKGHLRTWAREPLIINNAALGYRLYYNLLHFDFYQGKLLFAGTARFEELSATDADQRSVWQANRQKVYQGSLQHLMANLLKGTHEQAGYSVYRTPLMGEATDQMLPLVRTNDRQYLNGQQAQALFRPGEFASERRLVSDQPLEVYDNRVYAANSPYRDSPYAYSLLLMPKGTLELTLNGGITQSHGLDVRGYLGNERLATLLPTDWVPSQEESLLPGDITAGRPQKPDAGLDSLIARRQRQYERTAPVVYVQTDKALYATGDWLWLSAYVLDPARQLPLVNRTETPLQVELIGPSGRSVQHQWLQLSNGRAAASFRLADTLTAGTYRLRAYTALDQLANGPAFERAFPVYNLKQPAAGNLVNRGMDTPTGSTELAHHPPTDSLDLQFLPEGGRWLAGVPGRLGIKALYADGRGQLVSGRIIDQTGAEVSRFKTNKLGMGQVTLIPQPDQRYVAFVDGVAGPTARSVILPAVETEGWALRADADPDSSRLTVRVWATGRYSEQPVYITIQSREQLVYRQKWQLTKGEVHFSISTASLPPGVCRLTLWDMTQMARAERLLFVADKTQGGGIQMRVLTGKPRYEARESVAIGLQFRDGYGYPVTGSWSAAVTDADQLPADTTCSDLRTFLLLTSGLRGLVESPAYYLEPEHGSDLDNLLLTQGWRRLPASERPDSTGGWRLSGRVQDERGRPVGQKVVVITLEQGGQRILRQVQTSMQGEFRLGELTMADTIRMQVSVPNPGPGRAIVHIDAPGLRFPSASLAPPVWSQLGRFVTNTQERQTAWPAFYRDSTARQLTEVVVRANKPSVERPKDVQQASLHGAADGVLVVDRNVAGSVLKVSELVMRLPGLQLVGGKVRIGGLSSFGDNTPLYMIDGMPADGAMIDALNPQEVSRIELLKNATTAGMYGARAGAGVIAIYTVKGPVDALTGPPLSSVSITLLGFAQAREFYIPRYLPSSIQPDQDRRDVLYWEPLGENDVDGRARLVFPLSDTAKRLRLVVQGVTSEGVPLSFTWLLPVR